MVTLAMTSYTPGSTTLRRLTISPPVAENSSPMERGGRRKAAQRSRRFGSRPCTHHHGIQVARGWWGPKTAAAGGGRLLRVARRLAPGGVWGTGGGCVALVWRGADAVPPVLQSSLAFSLYLSGPCTPPHCPLFLEVEAEVRGLPPRAGLFRAGERHWSGRGVAASSSMGIPVVGER